MTTADKIEMKPGPFCPDCGEPMDHYGGTAGYIHCGWKLLYRAGGWFKHGSHVQDSRLAGPRQEQGVRCVAGVVQER
jgi:hypothetical protein